MHRDNKLLKNERLIYYDISNYYVAIDIDLLCGYREYLSIKLLLIDLNYNTIFT